MKQDLVGIAGERLRLLQRNQRLLVVALAALAFGDAYKSLRVLRVSSGDLLIRMLSIIELVIAQQRLGQRALGVQVIRIHVDGLLVGGDGVFRVLDLVVTSAEREGQLGGAVVFRNRFQRLDGVLEIAAFAIEPSKVKGNILGVGIDLLRCLELLLRQLRSWLTV